jgi:hypothetical protein
MNFSEFAYTVLLEEADKSEGILSNIGRKTTKYMTKGSRIINKAARYLKPEELKPEELKAGKVIDDDIMDKAHRHAYSAARKVHSTAWKATNLARKNKKIAGGAAVAAGLYGVGKVGAGLARRRDRKALRQYGR